MPTLPPCCDLGCDLAHPFHTTPPYTCTDAFGFTYRLCEGHYRALVVALARIRRAGREGGSVGQARGRALRRILSEEPPRCPP